MVNSTKETFLRSFIHELKGKNFHEKNKILSNDLNLQKRFKKLMSLSKVKNDMQKYLLKCLILVGGYETALNAAKCGQIQNLLTELGKVEDFFLKIGGILGYQHKVLNLLKSDFKQSENMKFLSPFFVDITKDTPDVRGFVRSGIEMLDQMGEIYVVGGAADRLHLLDEKAQKRLPAAMMEFFSKTLLKRLIEDVEAKESLYEKLTKKKTITPIALMCSNENDNFKYIKELIKQNNYFNRPAESFFFLIQPSVPVVTKEGVWVEDGFGGLLLKPSGHGALWKLAKDKKLFEWFFEKQRKKVLVRQINNPIAGVDFGLLAFTGYGLKNNCDFGFASCSRQVNSAEGVNVLIEKKKNNLFEYSVTNIEYCEFEKFKIEDSPIKKNEQFSKFSSNTNLLFVDLEKVQKKIDLNPYPGMLINFKPIKERKSIIGGRLETTMQNIADTFVEKSSTPLKAPYELSKIFVTYNERCKTISTTKRVYDPSKGFLETPERCFYDFARNSYDLLANYCLMQVPFVPSFEEFNSMVPPFLFSYHPAMGPLYKIIAQKLKGGSLKDNSELVLDIAEFFCDNLQLDGSLRIFASDLSASCFFENVCVKNSGINFASAKRFWKGDYPHVEKCDIYLGKGSTLIAKDVTFLHDKVISVPDNKTLEIVSSKGKINLKEVESSHRLTYRFSEDSDIEVTTEKNAFSQSHMSI